MAVTKYTVRPGDTLGGIARKFGVTLGVLIDTNNIKEANLIHPGKVLLIPSTATDAMDHPAAPEAPPPAPTPVPAALAIDQSTFRLKADCFFPDVFPKDLIVLHYTAGPTAQSAFNTWAGAKNRVATAYVIETDGRIFEFFDPKLWAFHLGVSTANHRDHKRSIGIEIVNVGPLRPDRNNPNQLNWWPPGPDGKEFGTKFCMKSQTDLYVEAPYRGTNFCARILPVQVAQTMKLVKHLCDRFKIPKQIPPPERRQPAKAQPVFAGQFKGVISHQSFSDNRVDIGPSWDWDRMFT